jgi:hypothetical protein
MIVQIRGTSGSGKSYVVHKILQKDLGWKPITEKWGKINRQIPLYYISGDGKIAVAGSYGAVCGGCDTLGAAGHAFKLYELLKERQIKHIVSEGLLLSEDTKWTLEAKARGWNPKVFHLTTTKDVCLKQLLDRREKSGNTKPLNKENGIRRMAVIERAVGKLRKAGVQCFDVPSKNCTALVLRTVGVQ